MSQSRAERRRSDRSGGPPPGKRDPMVPIYIGLAVVVVLIFLGFGLSNWFANRAHNQALVFDTSTPTPAPGPTSKPLPVKDAVPIGKATFFPIADLRKGILTDTKNGGQGQPVDGIPCETSEQVALHVHTHLALIYRGQTVQVPAYVGISPTSTGGCLYWIHTHSADGIIHVEAGDVSPPAGGPFTLGNFFDIWGQPLSKTQVGPMQGPVIAYVNGSQYTGDLKAIPLRAHQVITLEIGSPTVPPPNYQIPPQD